MAELSQTAGNVVAVDPSKGVRRVAGATIVAGEPVYRNANNVMALCKADAANTASCDGIALCGASANQPVIVLPSGTDINLGATLVVGQTYVVSANTAGKICVYSDLGTNNVVTVLGVATTNTNLDFQVINSATVKP